MELWIRKVQASPAAGCKRAQSRFPWLLPRHVTRQSPFRSGGSKFWDVQAGVYRWHEIMKSLDQRHSMSRKHGPETPAGHFMRLPIWSWHSYHRVPLNCSTFWIWKCFFPCQCAAVQRTSAVSYQNMFSSHLFQQKATTLTWAGFCIDWDSMI